MGFFDTLKQVFGGQSTPGPAIFKDLSAEELARLWRAKDALPTATTLGVRDEHLQRLLPLPPVDLPSLFSPPVTGLTDEDDAEQTLDVLAEYDPRALEAFEDLRVGPLGALVRAEDDSFLLVRFKGWRQSASTQEGLPQLSEGETLVGVVAASPEVDLSEHRAQGLPCHGDAEAPFTDPVTIAGTTALPHASYPQVLHVQTAAGLTCLFGSAVPLAVLEEEPDVIVGGLSIPSDTESLEAIAEGWDSQVAATSIEHLFLLPEAEGVDGLHAGEFCRSLGLWPRIQVKGQLLTVGAQAVVDAAEQGDWAQVNALAGEREETTLDEAYRTLFVSGRLDDAKALVTSVPREGRRADYLAAVSDQMSGRIAEARTAYLSLVEGEDAVSGAHCQLAGILADEGDWREALVHARAGADLRPGDPIAAANHAIAAWKAGEQEEAQTVMQETQFASRSWLGAMLDAMLHEAPGDFEDMRLLSVAGTHLGPYASALEALRSGRLAEGERLLRRCLDLAPIHPGASAHLAMHLAAEGRIDDALNLCTETMEALPCHVFLGSIQGWLLMHASRFAEAIAVYEHILNLSSDHVDWWVNLTLARVAHGDVSGAEKTINTLESQVRELDLIATLRRALRDAG